ncbi:hypothetical protein V2A60_004872 [Cordyceps javanica]
MDSQDQQLARMYTVAEMRNFSASEISVTPTTDISASRICGEVRRMETEVYHCIAVRYTGDRGVKRWACPERRQLIIRQRLQAACKASPAEGHVRVPDLLAYVYDDDPECDVAFRKSRIMADCFVWGGESEAKSLVDCVMIDMLGYPWLVDGFGAMYHEDIVQSDNKALVSLLNRMKQHFPEPEEVYDALYKVDRPDHGR